ncbi:uncharacterized protein [Rutidosis leptorrhynchoides]|uniref:uncharacterized protein isoform X2 n=1 Tax=Rutidosis leptorrhynchoides TaxID=125765 RepID=UPI003A9927F9
MSSNYNVILKERKLPMSLLNDHQKVNSNVGMKLHFGKMEYEKDGRKILCDVSLLSIKHSKFHFAACSVYRLKKLTSRVRTQEALWLMVAVILK